MLEGVAGTDVWLKLLGIDAVGLSSDVPLRVKEVEEDGRDLLFSHSVGVSGGEPKGVSVGDVG